MMEILNVYIHNLTDTSKKEVYQFCIDYDLIQTMSHNFTILGMKINYIHIKYKYHICMNSKSHKINILFEVFTITFIFFSH